MKEFASKLLELDRQARMLVEEANAYRDRLQAEIESEKENILREFNEHANRHIATVLENETKAAKNEAGELASRYKALSDELERIYFQECQNWENELFLRCIGGDKTG